MDIPEDEHLRLLMTFYKKHDKGSPKTLMEIESAIESEGFDALSARLDGIYGESPYDIWEAEQNGGGNEASDTTASVDDSDASWAFRIDEFDDHLSQATAALSDLQENWQDEDAATVGHLLVPAAQNLLTALVIKPNSAEVKAGLATIEAKDFRLLTTILTSTLMELSAQESSRLKPYCANIAAKIVDQGREAIKTSNAAMAMKLFQTALQIDGDNAESEVLFHEAESMVHDNQAAAEENIYQQALDTAQAKLAEAMQARDEFNEDLAASKYAAKLAGIEDEEDDELTVDQQEQLEQIEDVILEAEESLVIAKQSLFEHKAPVLTGWLLVRINEEESRRTKLVGGGAKKYWVILKQGVITAFEDDTPAAEELSTFNLKDCDDLEEDPEKYSFSLELRDENVILTLGSQAEFELWDSALFDTMDMIRGEGWDEIGDIVAEGTLHVEWKFDFRELNQGIVEPEHTCEAPWSFMKDGIETYRILAREIVKQEFKRKHVTKGKMETAVDIQRAIDWLLEELNFRCGVGDTRCKLIELAYAVQMYETSFESDCLFRICRSLKKMSSSTVVDEKELMLFNRIKSNLKEMLEEKFEVYKQAFPTKRVQTDQNLIRLAIECLTLVSDEPMSEVHKEIAARLDKWSMKLLSAMVGVDLEWIKVQDWHKKVPFNAKILALACDVLGDDVMLDVDMYLLLFPDEIMVVNIICEAHLRNLVAAAKALIFHCNTLEDFGKGNLLAFYQSMRDLIRKVEEFCTGINWHHYLHELGNIFENVLDAHIVRVQKQQEKWIERAIRQDRLANWELIDDMHSSSVDVIMRMLGQVTKGLLDYWNAPHIAKVLAYTMYTYCGRITDMNIEEIEAGDDDAEDDEIREFSLGSDVAGIGVNALSGLTKGITGVFTSTYEGAKTGNVLQAGVGLAKGVKGAATSVVVTGLNAANDATTAVQKTAQTARDIAGNVIDNVNEITDKVEVKDWVQRKMVDEGTKLDRVFYTRLNNIQKAAENLGLLAQDASPVLGSDVIEQLDASELDQVETELLRKHATVKIVVQRNQCSKYPESLNMCCIRWNVGLQEEDRPSPQCHWKKIERDHCRKNCRPSPAYADN
eukprot:SAG31_NODE_777_length_12167_cov_6.570683_5_plen_1095_part_00